MRIFTSIFLLIGFFANAQLQSNSNKLYAKHSFASLNISVTAKSSKKARTSFTKKMLATNACLSTNYGCAAAVPLAVIDLKFDANRISETNVQLNWTTTEEINNHGFEVQRKISNEGDFEKIGYKYATEQKNNENKYEFLDVNDANETSYYRLKIIENGGIYTFSKIIDVKSFDQSLALKIASNPIIGDEIVLEIFGMKLPENVNFAVFDILGRKILDTNQSVTKTNSKIKLSKNSDFKMGRYFVRASFKDKVLMNNFVIAQ